MHSNVDAGPDSDAPRSYRHDDPRGPTVTINAAPDGLEITLDDRTLVSIQGFIPAEDLPTVIALATAARRTVSAP